MPSQEASSSSYNGDAFQAIVPGTSKTVAVGAASLQSSALQTKTSIVRFFSTVDCFLAFGTNPTADATGVFLPGGILEYFGVTGGTKIAVIQSAGGGTLYLTEGA